MTTTAQVHETFSKDGVPWLHLGVVTPSGVRNVIEVPGDEPTLESWARRYGDRPAERPKS